MPYGSKKGLKAPGGFGVAGFPGLSLAALGGAFGVLVIDLQQKGEASSLFTMNKWVATFGEFAGFGHAPLWLAAFIVVIFGTGSIFYFQPATRKGAFALGLGLSAVILTAIPAELGEGLSGLGEEALGTDQQIARVMHGSYMPVSMTSTDASPTDDEYYNVQLKIEVPNVLPEHIGEAIRRGGLRGRLHNESTGRTYNLFRNAGGRVRYDDKLILIQAAVPANEVEARLWVRIELNGYVIEEQSADARVSTPLEWDMTLRPTSVPMMIRRFGRSFWF